MAVPLRVRDIDIDVEPVIAYSETEVAERVVLEVYRRVRDRAFHIADFEEERLSSANQGPFFSDPASAGHTGHRQWGGNDCHFDIKYRVRAIIKSDFGQVRAQSGYV